MNRWLVLILLFVAALVAVFLLGRRSASHQVVWYSDLAASVGGKRIYIIDVDIQCANGKRLGKLQVDLNLTNGKLRVVRNDPGAMPSCVQ